MSLLYELYKKHFGKPGRTLVVHAPTRALNPSFPQSQIDEVAADDPDTAAREYQAEWIDADSAYYGAALVDPALRSAPLFRVSRGHAAGMDPATRGNHWTLAVAWSEPVSGARLRISDDQNERRHRVVVGGVWSWAGSKTKPLSPRDTLAAVAAALRPYAVSTVHVDGWSFDAMADHGRAVGLTLVEHPAIDRNLPYQRLKTLLGNGDVELPPDPLMRADLVAVRQRATADGTRIHLPKTANGRHCDYAPSIALAVSYAASAVVERDLTIYYIPGRWAGWR